MQKKVTIIGAGAVGATTAFALLSRGAASQVVLIDINTEKAMGEALDIKQATPFIDNCDILAGSYSDAKDSDIVIITSGIGRKPGQSRLELVQTNVGIIKSIAQDIVKVAPNAIYIIVANPVDILTYAFLKYTGLPKNQVFGTVRYSIRSVFAHVLLKSTISTSSRFTQMFSASTATHRSLLGRTQLSRAFRSRNTQDQSHPRTHSPQSTHARTLKTT